MSGVLGTKLWILAVIRADAVRERRAHVVHAAERRQLDCEAVCARALGREGCPQTRDLANVAEPIVKITRALANSMPRFEDSLAHCHYAPESRLAETQNGQHPNNKFCADVDSPVLSMDGDELLRRVEAYGGFVVGHMVDRIARDWTLRAYGGVGEIWDHYPQRCPVTSQLLAGANTKWILVPKAIENVPVRWLNSHYLNVEPLIARTYGAIPQSLPFSHYRFAERARRSGRSDRIAKHLHKVRDTTGGVPRISDAAVSHLECGAACPSS